MLEKTSSLQRNPTKASFVLANKIAKQNKSFAEAEFIKDCMIDAVSVVCPEVKVKSRSLISVTKNYCSLHRYNCSEYSRTAINSQWWFSVVFNCFK